MSSTDQAYLAQRAFLAVDKMRAATNLDSLNDTGREVFSSLGLPYYALARFFAPDRAPSTNVLAGHFHPEWAARYIAKNYTGSSLIARQMLYRASPYTWSDVLKRTNDKAQSRIFEEASEFGMRDGLFAPVQWADGSFAAVTLAGSDADLADPLLRAMADVLASYYASEARRLLAPRTTKVILTPRQRECLCWVREGKSTGSIALLMGISSYVVDEHIGNACHRLGVRTRVQAAVEATRLGFLDVWH